MSLQEFKIIFTLISRFLYEIIPKWVFHFFNMSFLNAIIEFLHQGYMFRVAVPMYHVYGPFKKKLVE